MNDDNASGVPEAPYPPMRPATRNRSRSFSHGNKVAGKARNVNSPQPSRNVTMKRNLLARVEHLTSDIYGGVNCLEHVHFPSSSDENSYHHQPGAVHSEKKVTYQSQANARIKRMGPILLELRYLETRVLDLSREIELGGKELFLPVTGYQAKTFALSRGIPGAGAASCCLSFQKNVDANGNYISDTTGDTIHCATGLTTGALSIHSFRNVLDYIPSSEDDEDSKQWNILDSSKSDDASAAYFSHQQPRHHRHASSVAWRSGGNSNSRFVAIGLHNSGIGQDSHRQIPQNSSSGSIASKEKDNCLVWDIEGSKGLKQGPTYRLAHHSGVSSLEWIENGQYLAVGCSQGDVQLYDLSIKGTSARPTSVRAHENPVHGIQVDPNRSSVFATFSRGITESVKLWDRRKMNSCLAEIKVDAGGASSVARKGLPSIISDVSWDTSASGSLAVATNTSIRYYDTLNPSRPAIVRMSNSRNSIQTIAFQPFSKDLSTNTNTTPPRRMLVVETNGSVIDLPLHQVSPIAISNRDGRIAKSLGSAIMTGKTTEGPAAMEIMSYGAQEDISATMLRRARCLHASRYSTDPSSNLEMISIELKSFRSEEGTQRQIEGNSDSLKDAIASREQLYRLWSWIERVEKLCFRNDFEVIDERRLPAKGLRDAGILKLLKMDLIHSDEITTFDKSSMSSLFNRNVFDSPMRRAALTACGWIGKFGLQDVLNAFESRGKYERSAAIAVWNSDLGEAVGALQRGAAYVRQHGGNDGDMPTQYAETLELVAMCIAGYSGGSNQNSAAGQVWRRACESLLQRKDFNPPKPPSSYLKAICSFLMNVGSRGDLKDTLENNHLSLSDRVAFACIFLSRDELKEYLETTFYLCISPPNLEGILISGLNKRGIALIQSFVDAHSDVQTAALVSSRVVLPPTWNKEKMICNGWLETYRQMLNKWQMWQSRAMFDVGRFELLRKLKDRQQAEEQVSLTTQPIVRNMRRTNPLGQRRAQYGFPTSRHGETDASQLFPSQLHARCNYCNTSLSLSKLLRRQDGIANNWLSRQNPVLSCCPNAQCKKPLPKCAICLLPLGCLNPYLELRKHGLQNIDDLSDLSSLPFAEWFTWCMRCKHGGHAHHMVGWFSNHKTCPVSNCDCQCQFDGIEKLKRPGLSRPE